MKKTLLLVVAFLLLVPFASIDGSDVSSLNNSNGNILYVGGSGPNNYTSIQDAIDDAENGYTIYVYYRVYNESIVINKSVSLIGIVEDREKPIINGSENNITVLVEANNCTISGFIILNGEVGVQLRNSSYITVESITVKHAGVGIKLLNSDNNLIKNNEVTKSRGIGIWIDGFSSDSVIIQNSVVNNAGVGIGAEGTSITHGNSSNNIISYNVVAKNCDGIDICDLIDSTISFNQVYSNQQYGITAFACSNLSILNNSIHNHAYGGVLVSDSSNCTISGNELYSNQAGVMLDGTIGVNYEGSTHNVVTRNNIHGNGVGIYWESGCKNNYFTYNNIVDNSENAYFWTSLEIGDPDFPLHRPCQNIWNRNYWSDWTTSVPKPIRGMVTVWLSSFYIDLPWLTFDKHPATEPYGNNTLPNAEKYTDATAFIRETISLPPTSLPQTSNSLPRSPPR
ncbi:MAG: right-handed parallel beta-helix repeat-containing protein [Candidatus Thermoplasmatota archaeon]|nr:right-handed parallel beta-helix repeat-containing protein [Candidatus Thermoplasmatota archaeon]